MKQQSDTVQHTATAYAEREVLQASCGALPQVRTSTPGWELGLGRGHELGQCM